MTIFNCPNCDQMIFVEEKDIRCKIFRCGVYKKSGRNIPPHSSKEKCENYIKNNTIWGCSKPFRLIKIDDSYKAEICEYI